MNIILIIGLAILALLIIVGIIRVIIKQPSDFGELLLDLFLLDCLVDIATAIFSGIGSLIDDA